MKALLLDTIPMDAGAFKTASPTTFRITGSQVYALAVGRAILRYGTFDRYYFVDPMWAQHAPERAALEPVLADPRVRILPPTELPTLRDVEQLVIMNTGSYLFHLSPLRTASQRPGWPLFGVIHSLTGAVLSPLLVSLLLDDYGAHDALSCSTATGRQAVEQQFEALLEYLGPMAPRRDMPIKLPVIPLGLETDAFAQGDRLEARHTLDLPADATVLLSFGRLSLLSKGDLFPLLLAFREIHRDHPKALLIIAGDDTVYQIAPSLQDAVDRAGLTGAVRIDTNPGGDRKQALFAAADVFVAISDSLQETFGITITEAMAAGLPIVATDWDGYKELVSPGETGLLVPTTMPRLGINVDMLNSTRNWMGDRVVALATAIDVPALSAHLRTMIEHPDVRRRMGELARTRARQRFDWPVIVRAYESCWEESLEHARHLPRERTRTGHGIFTYAYDRVFAHYPTRMFDDGDTLDLSAWGTNEQELGWQLVQQTSLGFMPEVFAAIAASLRDDGATSLRELIGAVTARGMADEFLVRTHVGRMLKYGLLTHTPAAEAGSGTGRGGLRRTLDGVAG